MGGGDQEIVDEDLLYRRIARSGDVGMLILDENSGELRVRGGAFVMDADGCSIYIDSVMNDEGIKPTDLLVAPQNALVSVTAVHVRSVELDAIKDAWPSDSDGHPRDAAHGLIVNKDGFGSKRLYKACRRLAGHAKICILPSPEG